MNGFYRWCAVASLVVLAACSSFSSNDDDEVAQKADRPLEALYNDAWNQMDAGKYRAAADAFEEVERQYPYSEWAVRAKLMTAYAYYKLQEYDRAQPVLENFIRQHPANRSTSYAFYLNALCFYEQITDVGRDQRVTKQTQDALQEVINRYPDTVYARDARMKLDLVRDHLAGKEMEVGRYYLKQKEYLAAINRFRAVIDRFQTTSHTPEALHRLVEAYLILGVNDQATKYGAVLGYNYPGSEWYQRSYAQLTGKGIDVEKDGLLKKIGGAFTFGKE
jgi:outer membrane protein assembly factor BamD